MEFSGERYVPELDWPEISYEHWHRYLFASEFVKEKTVLDIACGEGYGSYHLSMSARQVIGIDINDETIRHASGKYVRSNLKYETGSASSIPIAETAVFDVIVSFETIEHLVEQEQSAFLSEVKRLLKPGGVFIASTPNRSIYSELHNYKNEFHFREFDIPDFRDLLLANFAHVDLLSQHVEMGSYIGGLEKETRKLDEYHLSFGEAGFRPTDEPREILYIVAVCSDKTLPKANASLALDLSNRMLAMREEKIGALQNQVAQKEQVVEEIYASGAWKLIRLLRRVRLKLAPRASLRERAWYYLLRVMGLPKK